MDVRKYEIYFECRPRDILFNTRNNFIFPRHPCIVLFITVYKIIVLGLPHKNKAVNSNAFHDNRHIHKIIMNNPHTCEIIDFISGGKINKPLYFIS